MRTLAQRKIPYGEYSTSNSVTNISPRTEGLLYGVEVAVPKSHAHLLTRIVAIKSELIQELLRED